MFLLLRHWHSFKLSVLFLSHFSIERDKQSVDLRCQKPSYIVHCESYKINEVEKNLNAITDLAQFNDFRRLLLF